MPIHVTQVGWPAWVCDGFPAGYLPDIYFSSAWTIKSAPGRNSLE